jgi:hypothetical protein
MRLNKVRGRDGAIREVSDGYVLRDGEARVVELPFMDNATMVHDGRGQPAGQRPGFLYSDGNKRAERKRVDAYTEYADAIQERWRGQQTPSKPAQVFDSTEAAVAAAYVEYADAIQQRWCK